MNVVELCRNHTELSLVRLELRDSHTQKRGETNTI
jgi:hypothetical protein